MPRTRFLYRPGHPKASELGFVSADDLGYEPAHDKRAPVFTDRYMEGTVAPDGTDIGTRGKRREYMRLNNVTDYSDFSDSYREGVRKEQERTQRREIQETVDRIIYSKI